MASTCIRIIASLMYLILFFHNVYLYAPSVNKTTELTYSKCIATHLIFFSHKFMYALNLNKRN